MKHNTIQEQLAIGSLNVSASLSQSSSKCSTIFNFANIWFLLLFCETKEEKKGDGAQTITDNLFTLC